MSIAKVIASYLRRLANWFDPPKNVLYVTVKLDASEFIAGIEAVERRLKSPSINGEIP